MKNFKNKKTFILLVSLLLATNLLAEETEKPEISGILYFDTYYIPTTATNIANTFKNGEFENLVDSPKSLSYNRAGFQIRRIYLTVDKKLKGSISLRVRLEAANKSYTYNEDKSMTSFIKDAWIKFKSDSYSSVLGIQNSIAYPVYEDFIWKYRDIEKIPIDLFKIRSSREFGFSISFNLLKNLKYNFLLGNGKGSETQKASSEDPFTIYSSIVYEEKPFIFEIYGDIDTAIKPSDKDKKDTIYILAGYASKKFRSGIQYIYQESGKKQDANFVNLISVPFIFSLSDNIDLVLRGDYYKSYKVKDKDTTGKVNQYFIIAGLPIKLDKNISIIPNTEIAAYKFEKNSLSTSIIDSVFKITISVKY